VVQALNCRPRLGEGRLGPGEVDGVGPHPTEVDGRRHAAIAPARGGLGHQAAMNGGEGLDSLAGTLQPLAQGGRLDVQGFGGVGRGEAEDLRQDVSKTVRTIEALKHRQGATDLHLFDQPRAFRLGRPHVRETVEQVVAETLEGHVPALDPALLDVEQVVHRQAEHPGSQPASSVELREACHHAHQDPLRRVLRVGAVPEHAKGDRIHFRLQGAHELMDSFAGAVDGPADELREIVPVGLRGHASINAFKAWSSRARVSICSAKAPSSSSSGTGGACRTKL